MGTRLAGQRILVVEDLYLLADDLRRTLADEGANVIGPAPGARQALLLLDEGELDFALLDINLGGGDVYPVADELRRRGTPFAFITGYSHSEIPAKFQSVPFVEKPFRADAVISMVAQTARPAPEA